MIYIPRIFKLFMFLMLIIFTSCSDDSNPVNGDDDTDHTRAYGIKISLSGATKVNYFKDEPVQGFLQVAAGDTSSHYEIEFFDEDSVLFVPVGGDKSLRFEIDDPNLFEIWQHPGEEGGFVFHLIGLESGNSNIIFKVYHGDHPDFVSKDVPVEIQ